MTDLERAQLLAVAVLLLLAFVAAPVAIAFARRHPERRTIARLSPLTLLSFVLWGALIAWAASDRRDDALISRWVARLRGSGMLPWLVVGLVVIGVTGGAAFTILR